MKYYPISLLLALLLTSSADAALVLSFSQPNATITVGQSINVDLILTQTAPIGGADITTNGLVAVDMELSLDTPVASVTAITPGVGFEESGFGSNPLVPLMSIQSIDAINGVTALAGSPTSIVLGTFTFTGNSIGTMTATTMDTLLTEFVFATNPAPDADIDGLIFGPESFTLNVTAVPEPSSMMLMGASFCYFVSRKFRSRGKKHPTN